MPRKILDLALDLISTQLCLLVPMSPRWLINFPIILIKENLPVFCLNSFCLLILNHFYILL